MMNSDYHIGVLLKESVDGLCIERNKDGVYVDVTFGAGGYSREMVSRIGNGQIVAFDQDEDALKNEIEDERFELVSQNFSYIKNCLRMLGVTEVDGIVADLGVSSHQFDVPDRGFSYRFNAELDMRMDVSKSLTAKLIVNDYEEEELKRVFWSYCDVKNVGRLVTRILNARAEESIDTTGRMVKVLTGLGGRKEMNYFSQVFQALRIEVNDELGVLRKLLEVSLSILKPGGRLVVVSYHSLEDRLVKNFFRMGKFEGELEKDFFGNSLSPFKLITRKPISPSEEEIKANSRARSAKLRIAEKI